MEPGLPSNRQLHQWVRMEAERHLSPLEAVIDSQSVKSAAGVQQQVGFDGANSSQDATAF
ncbi:MAG: hypothetical protein ACAF41_04645 [Leptolyngbya sp. BL-A-14]